MQGEAATIRLVLTSDPEVTDPALSLTELTARLRGEAGGPEEQEDTELGFLLRESGELVTWTQVSVLDMMASVLTLSTVLG